MDTPYLHKLNQAFQVQDNSIIFKHMKHAVKLVSTRYFVQKTDPIKLQEPLKLVLEPPILVLEKRYVSETMSNIFLSMFCLLTALLLINYPFQENVCQLNGCRDKGKQETRLNAISQVTYMGHNHKILKEQVHAPGFKNIYYRNLSTFLIPSLTLCTMVYNGTRDV